MEGFYIACLKCDKVEAVSILETAIKNNKFDTDEFMEAIYDAAAEDHDLNVRNTLIAVIDAAPRDFLDYINLNSHGFDRGTDWAWIPISVAYNKYMDKKEGRE